MRTLAKSILLGAGLATILAAPAAQAADDRAWCRGVAAHYRSWIGAHRGQAPRLDKLRPFITRDKEVPFTPAGLSALKAGSPDVTKALDYLTSSSNSLTGGQLSLSPFTVVVDLEGSMGCQDFLFLRRGPTGQFEQGPLPPQLTREQKDGDLSFCWNDWGWFGLAGGRPVFAEETPDLTSPDYDVELAPWRDGRWGSTCAISARFTPAFVVQQSFFPGSRWPALVRLAPRLVYLRNANFAAKTLGVPGGPRPDMVRYEAIRRLVPDSTALALPTFGKAFPHYDGMDDKESGIDFPIVLGGRTYFARLSRGTVGWRTGGDYVLGVWDARGGKLVPMAGVAVAQVPGRLTTFTVKGG